MDRDISLVLPVSPLPALPAEGRQVSQKVNNKLSFQETLQREVEKSRSLRFSAHAERRLRERNIFLAKDDLDKINKAMEQAEAKGARESLIIYGDLALIASIRNKTVVTAMSGNSSEDYVFTNIDSAVIVK